MRSLDDDSPDPIDPVDPRDVTPAKVGTPVRDAAVDPAPGDHLAPTGAGTADPHSDAVVSPTLGEITVEPAKPTSKGRSKASAGDDDTSHLQSRARR